ncbi:MAG: 4Fe-4S binding protein [Bradymonadales bacterium]|nr:4Fe-4S binding protein [Bradymonadales bacterium]
MATRKIIRIDEERCDGCGLCVPACAEKALQIIGGKARLVSETYCDGLGECLGVCPQGAITIEQREAMAFDPEAVQRRLAASQGDPVMACPSLRTERLRVTAARQAPSTREDAAPVSSALTHWPVKLALVPPSASFLRDADLVLMADCAAVASIEVHRAILPSHAVVIGCPKFDDPNRALVKLADILRQGQIRSLTVLHMEVPCCFGYRYLATQAMQLSGKEIPLTTRVVGRHGEIGIEGR